MTAFPLSARNHVGCLDCTGDNPALGSHLPPPHDSRRAASDQDVISHCTQRDRPASFMAPQVCES